MTAETIDAEIPYLRSELRSVHVEFESRILDERTVERRTMPVRNGRTASIPPTLAREARDVLPLHASTVRYSEQAHRDGMMTPAGWAHLDYGFEEAAVQLQETLDRSKGAVAPSAATCSTRPGGC